VRGEHGAAKYSTERQLPTDSTDFAATRAARDQMLCQFRQQRAVEQICQTPRLVTELLDEISCHHDVAEDIAQRIGRYAALDRRILAAVGGDRLPPVPLFLIRDG
jgi:hypothetical protein